MWGLNFDTKRSNCKELSLCTQKLIDGNHIKLGSKAYSQAWCLILTINAIKIWILKRHFCSALLTLPYNFTLLYTKSRLKYFTVLSQQSLFSIRFYTHRAE